MSQWLAKHLDIATEFHKFLSAERLQREGNTYWLDFYPFGKRVGLPIETASHRGVLLVDIGGGTGHELQQITKKFPATQGRKILQDLPQIVELVNDTPMMETMAHDFLKPQPVKGRTLQSQCWSNSTKIVTGARAYYFRNVLHEWPDAQCRTILQQTCAAMTKGYSMILINETILSPDSSSLPVLQSDLSRMSVSAGMERTRDQWYKLLSSVGLEVVKIWTKEAESESIIEAMLI